MKIVKPYSGINEVRKEEIDRQQSLLSEIDKLLNVQKGNIYSDVYSDDEFQDIGKTLNKINTLLNGSSRNL